METTRREFLLAAALAQSAMAQPPGERGWYDRPMRWAQIAFVEDDPGSYSPQFWFDYLKRTHCDAACLSAGGCVAFYPTKVPLHYRSKFLGNSDAFGDMLAGCRKLGMNVIARTDPHAAHQDVYDAHPDWIAVDAQGKKRRHWAMPELWVTCALGPYNFDFMTQVTREIVSMYKVDGVFSNRWAGSGMCYCEHCQENFHAFSGLDLPRTTDPRNAARRQYITWHQKRLFDLWKLWDAEIKAINPQASYIANAGGGALSDLDMKTIGELAPTLFADRQARRGVAPPWENGKNGKEYRATMGSKAIAGICSVGLEEPYRWKDSVQGGDEIRLWMVDGIAQGLRPWFTKFNAKPIDHRWMPAVEEVYVWHHKNERYLRNEKPLARVGMVYSQRTAAYYGAEQARQKVEDHALGFYQAMVEARIPFEMAHDLLLDAAHTNQFSTLILPNIAALSTGQCDQLRQFVERGGSIIATHETSLYDEWGARRDDFGLSDLFGVSVDGKAHGPVQNSYWNLEKDPANGKFHPLLRGLEDAVRVIGGANQVPVKSAAPSYSPLTLVPSYPDLPMEEVYARVPHTNIPGVYIREVGRGRVVYFPWDIDRTFWEVLALDHAKLLQNAVMWASRDEQPLRVKGPGVLDVAVWLQKDSMTVHLVNLTNPMMMKGPVREIIPVSAQRVSVRIPDGRKAGTVKFLVSGGQAHFRQTGNTLEGEVPQIALHEVIAIDLS
jgi:hypothetical protein